MKQRKPHKHTIQCITSCWIPCPGLSYDEWIQLASNSARDDVWRTHELVAREHAQTLDPGYVDLGGEA